MRRKSTSAAKHYRNNKQQQQHTKHEMKQPNSTILLYTSIIVVAFLAIWLGTPRRELDWEGDVLPMAQKKMGIPASTTSTTPTPLEGMIVVLTGATSGIGLALTKALSKLGATIIAIGRSPTKLATLEREYKGVEPIVANLDDLESVAKAATTIQKRFHHVDVVINNAGMHYKYSTFHHPTTAQGYDQVFQVNYLSHFLLTESLLPLLQNSTMPTILEISSSYHWAVDGSDLMPFGENHDEMIAAIPGATPIYKWRDQRSYANSKLAQILSMRARQRLYPNISMKAICPGWVATSIAGQRGTPFHFMLDKLAFDADTWGVTSTLYALTSTRRDEDDFISNSQFPQVIHSLTPLFDAPWMYKYGWRDFVLLVLAMALMPGQSFLPGVQPMKSSAESYNTTLQDGLYEWSHNAIQPYL